jgi:hypothetical protein
MQLGRRGAGPPPLGIAFEGDLGNRIDALLAVAMLNGFQAKMQARRIALCVSRASLKAAQLADVVMAFYSGRPIAGRGGGGVGGNPDSIIGMPEGASFATDKPALAPVLLKTTPEGTPQYPTTVDNVLDTADNAVLIRNMLLAQVDHNASIVLAGPATGLVRLAGLYGATPQIATKTKQTVVALGAYPSGAADPAVKADLAAARKLFSAWPGTLVAVGTEVGEALPYPGATIDQDFAWAPAHPVADAYRLVKPMPWDAPASALAAMLYAVHPDEGYFTVSEPGTIAVLDDGRTSFTASPNGKHRYLIVDPAQKDRVIALYREMVSARPAPRPGRGGRGNAAAQNQQNQNQQQQQQQNQRQRPQPNQPQPNQPPADPPEAEAPDPADAKPPAR